MNIINILHVLAVLCASCLHVLVCESHSRRQCTAESFLVAESKRADLRRGQVQMIGQSSDAFSISRQPQPQCTFNPTMARFEHSIAWDSSHTKDVEGMRINGVVLIPDSTLTPPLPLLPPLPRLTSSARTRGRSPLGYNQYTIPELLSPTDSVDSAFVSRPPSCNLVLPPSSSKHLLYGAPDFSVAVLDTATGDNERLSIPAPRVINSKEANSDQFTQGEVLTMCMVGERQVWAGTANATIHVFDLESTPEVRFSRHTYATLSDPVLHIGTRQLPDRPPATAAERVGGAGDTRMDVLLGSPCGYVTVISGEVDEQGGLKNWRNCLRKFCPMGDEDQVIHCITHVVYAGTETYWCGCGAEIVVIGRSNWKERARLNMQLHSTMPQQFPHRERSQHITQLLATEQGVWSCLSCSSSVSLWDARDNSHKMRLECCTFSPTASLREPTVQVTALAFSYPVLFVGTSGGHLLAFKTAEETPIRRLRRGSLPAASTAAVSSSLPPLVSQTRGWRTRGSSGDKLLGATHCGPYSVVSIYVAPSVGRVDLRMSPLWSPVSSPGSSAVVVVVVCAPRAEKAKEEAISISQVQMYELVSTPPDSPDTSPNGSVSPTYLTKRTKSISSSLNGSNSPTQTVSRSLPPLLSVVSAAPSSLSILPLETNQ